mgnify:CR=1 FL=1
MRHLLLLAALLVAVLLLVVEHRDAHVEGVLQRRYRGATLAEDEIFLALTSTAAMTCFVFAQFQSARNPVTNTSHSQAEGVRFWGTRPWLVVGLFVAAGLSNLTKGVGFGPLMVFIPVTTFVLLARDWSLLRRYLWAWGAILFLLIGLWWPLVTALKVPGSVELWRYDLFGRASGDYGLIQPTHSSADTV